MSRLLGHRPSPAMVLALLALFIAMAGTSYAAIKLPANSVGSKQIQANAVAAAPCDRGAQPWCEHRHKPWWFAGACARVAAIAAITGRVFAARVELCW
jgi:hypothetical protein